MAGRVRTLIRLGVGTWPASGLKNMLLRRLGWEVHPNARIGPALLHRVGHLSLADGASIGPFTVMRDLERVELGTHATIGQWNWISASSVLVAAGGTGTLTIGDHSALTSRHYVDASGGVSIGRFTTVAGVRSTFITHGINWRESRQTTSPIRIGDYCLVSSNNALTPGTVVEDRVVTGMGATLAGVVGPAGSLFVGGRGTAVKERLEGAYFTRTSGWVGTEPVTTEDVR